MSRVSEISTANFDHGGIVATLSVLVDNFIYMAEKYVRLQVWVTSKQKAQVKKWAKMLAKANRTRVSESDIIRSAINYQIDIETGR